MNIDLPGLARPELFGSKPTSATSRSAENGDTFQQEIDRSAEPQHAAGLEQADRAASGSSDKTAPKASDQAATARTETRETAANDELAAPSEVAVSHPRRPGVAQSGEPGERRPQTAELRSRPNDVLPQDGVKRTPRGEVLERRDVARSESARPQAPLTREAARPSIEAPVEPGARGRVKAVPSGEAIRRPSTPVANVEPKAGTSAIAPDTAEAPLPEDRPTVSLESAAPERMELTPADGRLTPQPQKKPLKDVSEFAAAEGAGVEPTRTAETAESNSAGHERPKAVIAGERRTTASSAPLAAPTTQVNAEGEAEFSDL